MIEDIVKSVTARPIESVKCISSDGAVLAVDEVTKTEGYVKSLIDKWMKEFGQDIRISVSFADV